MKRYQFDVAALTFECQFPDEIGIDIQKLLPSYIPFINGNLSNEPVFVAVASEYRSDFCQSNLLESFSNDLGEVNVYQNERGYLFSFHYPEETNCHFLETEYDFSKASMFINWNNQYSSVALTSMLRILYAQRVLFFDGISIHSSVVVKDNKAYLFLGKSGTGKSTHSRLWLKYIDGTCLLNDDNPICRFVDGRLKVFGSPWSGKTPCYRNESAEVVAFTRLEQSPVNSYSRRTGVIAWTEVFPSCSVLKESSALYDLLVKTLNRIVSKVIIGHLNCLPNQEAAILCEKNIRQLLQKSHLFEN